MNQLLIIFACFVTALAAPQGYKYKEPAPVVEHGNLNGFQPIAFNGLPCTQPLQNARDTFGTENSLIQSQSSGRIVNHQPHYSVEQNLDTAASAISSQSEAVTLNSQITVGDSGSAASSFSGASQVLGTSGGYTSGSPAHTSSQRHHYQALPQQQASHFNAISQQLPQIPVHPFNIDKLSSGNLVSSQAASGHTLSYSYNQGNHNVHHHNPVSSTGAIINGIGKVPPPAQLPPISFNRGFQYAPGFASNKFSGVQSVYGTPLRSQPQYSGNGPYETAGAVASGSVGIQHSANQFAGNNYQHTSSGYAGSYTHGANLLSGHSSQSSGSFNNAHSLTSDALNGQLGHVIRETFANAPLDPSIEKHIYVHVPPEDLEDNRNNHASTLSLPKAPPKKHYKIIFIKAPTVAAPNYAQLATAAAQQSEEKTLVYVLVKKPDEPSVEELQQIQQSTIKSSKPEVYFIKYKTRKEGEGQGPVYAGPTHYSTENQFSLSGGDNLGVLNTNLVQQSEIYPKDTSGIDIRLGGGESSSVSTSTAYSTSSSSSSSSSVDHAPQHELYGVPLE